MSKESLTIAILTADPAGSGTRSIIKAGEKKGHKMISLNPADMYIYISDKESGFDKVYNGKNQFAEPERLKARDIDAIIPRIGANLDYGTAVLEHFTRNLGIYATQDPDGIRVTANKLISLQRFSQAKLKVPRTVMADKAIHIKWLLKMVNGLPAISKALFGSQGKAVYPLINEYQTNTFIRNIYDSKTKMLIQEFIDGDSKDIRCIVIDDKVIVAMERTAKKGELRANISMGGSGRKIELSPEDQDIAVRAARSCGLHCAGVDLMKDKEGNTYVIESNGNYGYHVEEITGVDISTPLIEMCEKHYKKGGKGTAVNGTSAEGGEPEKEPFPDRRPGEKPHYVPGHPLDSNPPKPPEPYKEPKKKDNNQPAPEPYKDDDEDQKESEASIRMKLSQEPPSKEFIEMFQRMKNVFGSGQA